MIALTGALIMGEISILILFQKFLTYELLLHVSLLLNLLGLLLLVAPLHDRVRLLDKSTLVFSLYFVASLVCTTMRLSEPDFVTPESRLTVFPEICRLVSWLILSLALGHIIFPSERDIQAQNFKNQRFALTLGLTIIFGIGFFGVLLGASVFSSSLGYSVIVPTAGLMGLGICGYFVVINRYVLGLRDVIIIISGGMLAKIVGDWIGVLYPPSSLATDRYSRFWFSANPLTTLSEEIGLMGETLVIVALVGMMLERKRHEAALKRRVRLQAAGGVEDKYAVEISESSQCMLVTDFRNATVLVSKGLEAVSGINRNVWLKKSVFSLIRLNHPLRYYRELGQNGWDSVRFITFLKGLGAGGTYLVFFKCLLHEKDTIGYLWCFREAQSVFEKLHEECKANFLGRLNHAAIESLAQGLLSTESILRASIDRLKAVEKIKSLILLDTNDRNPKIVKQSGLPCHIDNSLAAMLRDAHCPSLEEIEGVQLPQECLSALQKSCNGIWGLTPLIDRRFLLMVNFSHELPLTSDELTEGLKNLAAFFRVIFESEKRANRIRHDLILLKQLTKEIVTLDHAASEYVFINRLLNVCKNLFECDAAWLLSKEEESEPYYIGCSETFAITQQYLDKVNKIPRYPPRSGEIILDEIPSTANQDEVTGYAIISFMYSPAKLGYLVLMDSRIIHRFYDYEPILLFLSCQLNITFSRLQTYQEIQSYKSNIAALHSEMATLEQEAVTVMSSISDISNRLATRYRKV